MSTWYSIPFKENGAVRVDDENEMVVVLNVAEKNSVTKELVRVFSQGQNRSMRTLPRVAQYNPITEISNFPFPGLGTATMILTSVSGHLMELDFSSELRSWHKCRPSACFDGRIVWDYSDNCKIKQQLQQLAPRATHLVLWLDCDREGEAISFEVINCCREVKQTLTIKRAWFSALTAPAITQALTSLREPDQNVSDAVLARQEIDLRLGAAFTRLQTLRLQSKFPRFNGRDESGKGKIVSYGPCQFPTLGFIVERYWQNKMFRAEAFWQLECSLTRDGERAEFNWARGRLYDRFGCFVLYDMCMDNPTAKVIDVTRKPKSKWRPKPLATIELQKLASRWLHLSSETTMEIAERLYQQGYLSYPRTETDRFGPEYDLRALAQLQVNDNRWGGYTTNLLQTSRLVPRNGENDDKAHPPIHPVKAALNLSGNEQRIYELVTRTFLATISEDARGAGTEVRIDICGEEFSTTGLVVEEKNFLDVYTYQRWNANSIPLFELGEDFSMTEFSMIDGKTTAPPLLSEEDLIAKMDDNGIGTDATIHDHIKKVQEKGYVRKDDDRRFKPTEVGIALIDAYQVMGHKHLSEPALRAEMENGMTAICRGTRSKDEVMQQVLNNMRGVFREVEAQMEKMDLVMAQYFPAVGQGMSTRTVSQMSSECGVCHSKMQLMQDGPLYFVRCRLCSRDLTLASEREDGLAFEPKAAKCPLCHFELLQKKFGRKSYELCPWCHNHPQPAQCVCQCQCGAQMEIQKHFSDFYIGCEKSGCAEVIGLPKGCIAGVTVSQTPCKNCPRKFFKLNFKLRRNAVPPGTPSEVLECPLCDNGFINDLGNNLGWCKGSNQPASRRFDMPSSRPGAVQRQDRPQSNAFPCTRCGQLGHAAENCGQNQAARTPPPANGAAECYICKQRGHFAPQCPQRQGQGGVGTADTSNRSFGGDNSNSTRCHNCHQPGHFARDCPQKGGQAPRNRPSNNKSINQKVPICSSCGHPKVQMSVKKDGVNQGRQFWSCKFKCANQFEWADSGGSSSNNNSSVTCFNCGQPGHFASNCPSKVKPHPALKRFRHT